MKALYAGLAINVPLNTVRQYQYNCKRKPWEIEYYIPVSDLEDVQVYIYFGTIKPVSAVVKVINLCDLSSADTTACRYVLGVAPDGTYYGVFTFAGAFPGAFVIPAGSGFNFAMAIDVTMQGASVRRYFTEGYSVEPCGDPLRIEACFPVNSNDLGYDTNDIYFGYTTDTANSAGNPLLRYQHYVLVRQAKVFEDAPKVTFSSNIRQNFKTVLNRIYELRTELVPAWYKEYLLAVYSRGFIQVDGLKYQVTDLAMEGIDDNDHTWKPYAKLKKETRFYFGCDDTPCNSSCVSPCGAVTATVQTIVVPCASPEPDSVSATVAVIVTGLVCGDSYSATHAANTQFAHPAQAITIYSGTVNIEWNSFDRPNRFSIYRDGALLITTGWKGMAAYSGVWGASLSTAESGTMSYNPTSGHTYELLVEAGGGDPSAPMSDNFLVNISCT